MSNKPARRNKEEEEEEGERAACVQGAGNGEGGVDGGIERGGKEVMMPSLFGAEVTEGYMGMSGS